MKYAVGFLSILATLDAFASKPLSVPIHFFEALAPRDTTSSDRFQKEYEGAVQTGKALVAQKLRTCGYAIEEKIVFYGASDALEALERGKASEAAGTWMMVGPRRSNHYVLLAKGASKTPSVSTMASSQEAEALRPLHLSIAPSNATMAAVAAREAKYLLPRGVQATYASLVSEDCVTCVDFAAQFDKASVKTGLKKLGELRVTTETPDLSKPVEAITALKPSIVLVPNYSKVSAQTIAAVRAALPSAVFIGGDGWGDSRFGFVQDAKSLNGTVGITVRGFPDTQSGLRAFPLGKQLAASKEPSLSQPGSATALSILKIIEGTANLLCASKPKNAEAFRKAFLNAGKKHFRSPWGVSIYRLKDGDISFQKLVGR